MPSLMQNLKRATIAMVVITGCAGCQSLSMPPARQSTMDIGDIALAYADQGSGAPVVMVHGAFSDHRIWEAQRQALAAKHRYIAIDQRYFGARPWSDNGERYAVPSHAADLAAFVRRLDAGPVHLVGWSYGGSVVLSVALAHPELVRSIVVNEAPIGGAVTDAAGRAVLADERKDFGPIVAASKAGDSALATRLFTEWVNAQPGGFDHVPPQMRAVHLDNQRTTALQLRAPPPALSCEQLASIKAPTLITRGEQTRPMFAVITHAMARCMPQARVAVIPNARHLAPYENPADFNRAVLDFLAGH